jgi:CHASE3 domain sensor protein
MKEYIQFLIQKKGLRFSLILIVILVCLNAALVIFYRNVIDENSDLAEDIQMVKNHLNTMNKNINLADMGVRAYIIKQSDQLLDPYMIAKNDYKVNLDNLERGLVKIGYDVSNMAVARIAIVDYMKTCELMVDLCKGGRIDEAFGVFEEDRGLTAWQR